MVNKYIQNTKRVDGIESLNLLKSYLPSIEDLCIFINHIDLYRFHVLVHSVLLNASFIAFISAYNSSCSVQCRGLKRFQLFLLSVVIFTDPLVYKAHSFI